MFGDLYLVKWLGIRGQRNQRVVLLQISLGFQSMGGLVVPKSLSTSVGNLHGPKGESPGQGDVERC